MPPETALLNEVVWPVHTLGIPVMPPGEELTVTVAVAMQPVENSLYVITDVPAVKPLTTPENDMLATLVLLLLQVPPGVALLNAEVVPAHNPVAPVMTDGTGYTITVIKASHPVPKL